MAINFSPLLLCNLVYSLIIHEQKKSRKKGSPPGKKGVNPTPPFVWDVGEMIKET